jgi:hypothetical protein
MVMVVAKVPPLVMRAEAGDRVELGEKAAPVSPVLREAREEKAGKAAKGERAETVVKVRTVVRAKKEARAAMVTSLTASLTRTFGMSTWAARSSTQTIAR